MSIKITESELLAELDKLRGGTPFRQLTKEQRHFLIKARIHPRPVPFHKLPALWEQLGWGKYSESSIRKWWYQIEQELKKQPIH